MCTTILFDYLPKTLLIVSAIHSTFGADSSLEGHKGRFVKLAAKLGLFGIVGVYIDVVGKDCDVLVQINICKVSNTGELNLAMLILDGKIPDSLELFFVES